MILECEFCRRQKTGHKSNNYPGSVLRCHHLGSPVRKRSMPDIVRFCGHEGYPLSGHGLYRHTPPAPHHRGCFGNNPQQGTGYRVDTIDPLDGRVSWDEHRIPPVPDRIVSKPVCPTYGPRHPAPPDLCDRGSCYLLPCTSRDKHPFCIFLTRRRLWDAQETCTGRRAPGLTGKYS